MEEDFLCYFESSIGDSESNWEDATRLLKARSVIEMLDVAGVVKFAMCKKLFNRWCPHSVRIDSG